MLSSSRYRTLQIIKHFDSFISLMFHNLVGKKAFPELHAFSPWNIVVRTRFIILSPAKNWVLNLGAGRYSV